MPKSGEIISYLNSPAGEQYLERMYGKTAEAVSRQKDRFLQLKSQFESAFPHTIDLEIFSASGRTEVGEIILITTPAGFWRRRLIWIIWQWWVEMTKTGFVSILKGTLPARFIWTN